MRILGIDPGIRRTGYGLIAVSGPVPALVDYGIITPPTDSAKSQRLAVLYHDQARLEDQYHPDELAIESTIYGANARSALVLGQAKGVALLCAAHHQLPISEYAPRKIKLATTGNGRASKEQVQYMVQAILHMDHLPDPLDASDALAVAICHQQQLRPVTGAQP